MSSRRRGDGVLLLLGSAAVAMSVAAAVLEYRRRRLRRLRRGCRDHGERFADALCLREKVRRGHPSDEVAGEVAGSLLNMAAEVTLLRPGIVLIKRALLVEAQQRVLENVLATGHGQRRWWCRVRRDARRDGPRRGDGPPRRAEERRSDDDGGGEGEEGWRWALTGERQGRGRVYDAVGNFAGGDALLELCRDCVRCCRAIEPPPQAQAQAKQATASASGGRTGPCRA